MSIITVNRSLARNLGDIIAGRPLIMPEPSPLLGGQSLVAGSVPGANVFREFFDAVRTPSKRINELDYYDYLEREISDVRRALDAYATMAVTGNLAGGGTTTYSIRPVLDEAQYPDELLERLKVTEALIQRHAYTVIRMMAKYGSYVPELVLGRHQDARNGVVNLRAIPPGTMFRNIIDGRSNIETYWKQVIDGKKVAEAPQWKCPHFALWSNIVSAKKTLIYGTSILQPFGAIGLKVHAALDAAVVARLTRAAMRYVWQIDVSDIKNDQGAIARRIKKWQRSLSRAGTIHNTTTDEQETYQKTAVPDADFFVPAAEGLKYGLDTLEGDTNLARVGDIELLVRFYFGALGMPPEYLGHERSQGGRSNLSQVDINFARSSRFIQMSGAAGFEHLVCVDMALGGWDPREFPIEVVPPPIGARDDLLQAQIRVLQSTVISNLRAAGMKLEVNPRWILEVFLGLDDELTELSEQQVSDLFDEIAPEPSQGPPPGSPAAQEVRAAIAASTGDLMNVVRSNVRLLMLNENELAPQLHRHDQPSPGELADAIRAA